MLRNQPTLSLDLALLALPAEQQRPVLQTHIQKTLAQVLRMAPERIEPKTPLGLLGLESIMSVEFRNRLEASLTKQQILELYLNEIFLGYRSYGVAAAAYNFRKLLKGLALLLRPWINAFRFVRVPMPRVA